MAIRDDGPNAQPYFDVSALPQISSESHRWRVAEASYGKLPLIIRLNEGAHEWVGHSDLSLKLGFAVPLNRLNGGGLPDAEENEELSGVEDVIRREVEARATGIHVLVLTTGTMKEFVFYICPGADIRAIHEATRRAVSTHKVQCMAIKDPKWDAFTRFATERHNH